MLYRQSNMPFSFHLKLKTYSWLRLILFSSKCNVMESHKRRSKSAILCLIGDVTAENLNCSWQICQLCYWFSSIVVINQIWLDLKHSRKPIAAKSIFCRFLFCLLLMRGTTSMFDGWLYPNYISIFWFVRGMKVHVLSQTNTHTPTATHTSQAYCLRATLPWNSFCFSPLWSVYREL